uniref:Uncharacterized protein n=1 Tax=Tanacetum cinerariifolium TaxID=118510 RepID=A0A6L2JE51_TANCI|nr:hypothetical protein [Tanacetum cinerariifolium]
MIMKGNEKNNETLITLTPILSVEDKRYEALQVMDTGCRLFPVGAPFTQGTISSIPIGGNISLEGFLLLILLLVVIIVMVVIVAIILVVVIVVIVGVVIVVTIIGVVVVIVVFAIIKLSFVIIAVTFPSILLGKPSMKTSISFLEFGTIVGYKVVNSWNLLIPSDLVGLLYSNRFGKGIPPGQGILDESTSRKFYFAVLGTTTTRKYRFSSFKPMNETNSSFRTIELERLAAYKPLVSAFPCYMSSLGLVVLSVFAMLVACASRAAETLSATSFLMSSGVRLVLQMLMSFWKAFYQHLQDNIE